MSDTTIEQLFGELDSANADQALAINEETAQVAALVVALTQQETANTALETELTNLKATIASGNLVSLSDISDKLQGQIAEVKSATAGIRAIYQQPVTQPAPVPPVVEPVPVTDAPAPAPATDVPPVAEAPAPAPVAEAPVVQNTGDQ